MKEGWWVVAIRSEGDVEGLFIQGALVYGVLPVSRVDEGEEGGVEKSHDGIVLLLFLVDGDSKTVERERSASWDSGSEELEGGREGGHGGEEGGSEVDGEDLDEREV